MLEDNLPEATVPPHVLLHEVLERARVLSDDPCPVDILDLALHAMHLEGEVHIFSERARIDVQLHQL